MEEMTIIHDLTIVIVCAAVVSFVFSRFNIPVILGFLLSGLIVGPNTFYTSLIQDEETIRGLSELGVVFLMFYIGLEFDLGKVRRLMGPAFAAVCLQTIAMIFLGVLTAPLLGWSGLNGLFLGSVLAISSTMVTFGVIQSQEGNLNGAHAQQAVGMLILEDIVAIILLVILSGVAVTGHFAWGQVWEVTFFVGVFVMMTYVLGKLLVPKILERLVDMENQEVVLLVTMGMLLGLGLLAVEFKFSIALGSFIAGAILCQTELSEHIEEFTQPFRDFFSAIFFVTVGMLIEPMTLIQEWLPILIISILLILGKIVTVWFGLTVSGQSPRNSFRAALCKAQIAEFSFIITALGEQLGVIDPRLSTLAVGVALLTILATPVLNGNSNRLYDWLNAHMPRGLRDFGEMYFKYIRMVKEQFKKAALLKLVRRPALQILGYFLLFNGVVIVASYSARYVERFTEWETYIPIIQMGIWVAAVIISLPFFVAVVRNFDAMLMLITEAILSRTASEQFMQGRIRNVLHSILLGVVLIICGGIYFSASASYFPTGASLGFFVLLLLGVSFVFWKQIVHINSKLEWMFVDNLDRQARTKEHENRRKAMQKISDKHPWPIDVCEVAIEAGTSCAGKKIMETGLRQEAGVSILAISRGDYVVYDPDSGVPLFPGDHVFLVGEKSQNEHAKRLLGERTAVLPSEYAPSFQIEKVYLDEASPIVGNTLAGANLRRRFGINVIGLQRGEERVTALKPEEILCAGDLLLIVGSRKSIETFQIEEKAYSETLETVTEEPYNPEGGLA
ncbi:MAG: hypothetical protein Tsb0018_05740 [Opitutales bacterium]